MAPAKRNSKAKPTKPAPTAADPTPVFPESAFIGLFADYRALVAPTTEAPDSFHWASLLAVISSVIGRQTKLVGGHDGISPIIHVALLGKTGKARKSTAMDAALVLVVDAIAAAAQVASVAHVRLESVDGEAVRVEPIRIRPVAAGLTIPLAVVRGTGSGEGLAEALADTDEQKGKRALFAIDELGALFEKAQRGQAGNLVDLLLRLYDAPPKFEHRTRKSSFTVTGGSGVFLGASTVEWIHRTLTESHVRRGLVSRFLWVLGDRKTTPLAQRPPVDPDLHERFVERAIDRIGSALGKTYLLTTAAARLHQKRYEAEYHRDEDSDLHAAAAARADGLALRLSLLLAVADGADEVDRQHIQAAWAVVDYSQAVAGTLIDNIGTRTRMSAEDRVLKTARRIAESSEGSFGQHAVFQNVKGTRGMTKQVFDSTWNALTATNRILQAVGDKWRLA